MIQREVREYGNGVEMSHAAAEFICEFACECVAKNGSFSVALSGGSTPAKTYALLAQEPFRKIMPWPKTHIFFGDERFVPAGHPESNFRMANTLLLSQVPIPKQNIFPIDTQAASVDDAAQRYENLLEEFFTPYTARPVTFDLILLGVGTDGHTASLFPHSPALTEKKRWVAGVKAPEGVTPPERITLTFSAINLSRCVLFLCGGKAKKDIINMIINDEPDAKQLYPAACVETLEEALWFVDTEEF